MDTITEALVSEMTRANKFPRVALVVVAATLVLGVTACGDDTSDENGADPETTSQGQSPAEDPAKDDTGELHGDADATGPNELANRLKVALFPQPDSTRVEDGVVIMTYNGADDSPRGACPMAELQRGNLDTPLVIEYANKTIEC